MTSRGTAALLCAASLLLGAAAPARAQVLEDAPKEVEGVGIVERLDAQLPLDLPFRDEDGKEVTLRSFFHAGRPVVVTLNYFSCPMLCSVFLDGLTATLEDMDWVPGRQFDIVTVSIDPRDDAAGATKKRAHFIEKLGKPEAAAGWHFLTGSEADTKQLADSLGFTYRFLPDRGEFAHSAGLFVVTPTGRLSRTITGVAFEPETVRLALVEASEGKIGSPMDQLLLFCFAYDHTAGRYGPTAMKVMRLFGLLTMLVLAVFLAALWRREARRHRPANLGASS